MAQQIAGRWDNTNIVVDPENNAYPPVPVPEQLNDDEIDALHHLPGDEVIHLLKSLKQLWQPPVWHEPIFVAPNTTATPEYTFNLQGLWQLNRLTLLPFNAPIMSAPAPNSYQAATYPSQVVVMLPSRSSVPWRLDSAHNDIGNLKISVFGGAKMQFYNCDATNGGLVWVEFEQVLMPEYKRAEGL